MATRYSGELTIHVKWVEDVNVHPHNGFYDTSVIYKGRRVSTPVVRAPAHLTVAVDSAEAYDQAAGAALSFANDEEPEIGEQAAYSRSGASWYIARDKKKKHGGD